MSLVNPKLNSTAHTSPAKIHLLCKTCVPCVLLKRTVRGKTDRRVSRRPQRRGRGVDNLSASWSHVNLCMWFLTAANGTGALHRWGGSGGLPEINNSEKSKHSSHPFSFTDK